MQFSLLNGLYRNAETDVTISILHLQDHTYSVVIGTDSTRGQLVTPTKMLADNYVLHFEPDGHIRLDGNRIMRVWFRKQ